MRQLIIFLSTLGYVGKVPYASGTAGSLVGLLVILAVWNELFILLLGVLSLGVGLLVSPTAVSIFKKKDPKSFVLDEFCGMMISFAFVPLRLELALLAFGLFRFFDIVKPLGIRKIDNSDRPGAIMWDDVLAGIYANAVIQILLLLF